MTRTEWKKLKEEQAKLTDPFERIAFNNRWVEGVPLGLILMMSEEDFPMTNQKDICPNWESCIPCNCSYCQNQNAVMGIIPGKAKPKTTLQDLAKEAIDVQDACNLSGVVHGFSRAITALRERFPNISTNDLNHHPICLLWSSKIAALTGSENEGFSQAYSWCKRQAEQSDPVLPICPPYTQEEVARGIAEVEKDFIP